MIASAHGHLFTSLFFFGFIALSLGLTWWSMRRARDATGFFVAGRRLTGGKTAWLFPATTCPRHLSWVSQASFRSSAMTACCTHSASLSAG